MDSYDDLRKRDQAAANKNDVPAHVGDLASIISPLTYLGY